MSGLAASTDSTGTILEFDSGGNIAPSAGTHNTVSAIDTSISALDAPYAMSWQAGSSYTFNSSSSPQILAVWDTLSFGNSANMASKSTWTCPASGLWNILASYGISLNVTNGFVEIQLYNNGSSVFFTTFWVNVSTAGEGIVKNIESVLINLSSGDTLAWYITTTVSFYYSLLILPTPYLMTPYNKVWGHTLYTTLKICYLCYLPWVTELITFFYISIILVKPPECFIISCWP